MLSFLRRRTFFESLHFPQSVVYKSSNLLKYDSKVTSSLEEYKKFSIALQIVFCEKKIRFRWDYYGLLVEKLAIEIQAISLDFPSEFTEVIFLFFPVEFDKQT